jgi:hypothetical protein
MSFRRRLKNKRVPAGFDQIEEVIEDFENQMKEAVNEEHDGLRKNQSSWKIHRLHWEKNRFIYDLMYKRKVMSRELVSFFQILRGFVIKHCLRLLINKSTKLINAVGGGDLFLFYYLSSRLRTISGLEHPRPRTMLSITSF